VRRIDEVVVVPLEDIPVAVNRDDPVQDHHMQQAAVVGDDLAHPVVGGRPDQGEIPGVKRGLHADPARDHVHGPPADLRRRQEQPKGARYKQQGAGDEARSQSV
jgi:hypothetical protein